VVIDRHEDVTDPNMIDDDPDCQRSMVFYGYVRGTHLRSTTAVHLVGVGDYSIVDLSTIPDPCPLPEKESERQVCKMNTNLVVLEPTAPSDVSQPATDCDLSLFL
jgi:ribosome biogenesis protein BMS1